MRTVKLDENRDIREDGFVVQIRKPSGSKYDPGEVWMPPVRKKLGRRTIRFNGKRRYFSRVLWAAFNGPIPKGMNIDHINGDKSDDRLENLRCVTPSENNMAFNKPRAGTSGYRGVHFCKERGKWVSTISKDGKRITLGRFDSPKLAAIHRDWEAMKLGWPKEGLNFA